jgi:glycosyltransferase involved in cell wall biosynthesis
MPRLLLVTYHYPPRHSAGSIRPGGLAKYLGQFGWDVTVLTPQLPAGTRPLARVIETEYRSVLTQWKSRLGMDPYKLTHDQLRLSPKTKPASAGLQTSLLEYARSVVAFPDEYKGWIPFAVKSLSDIKATEKPDVILSTSPPASCHLIAARAKTLFRCPWVADLRDLWTDNSWGVPRSLRPWHRRLERRTLRAADALVTVSTPWARRLQEKYPTKPVYSITNGFDPDDFPVGAPRLTGSFSITHTGYLYEGKRDPGLLFEVLRDLIREGRLPEADVRVRLYGHPEPWLPALVARYGLEEVVDIAGVVSREEALMRQSESQLLLLLGWSDPSETGQHTGKLFEYFGSARPILAVGGSVGVLTETLDETKAGVHVSNSKERLRQYLIAAYGEFKERGFVSYAPDPVAVGRYTHREMARQFAEVLDARINRTRTQNHAAPEDREEHRADEVTPRSYSATR